MTLGLGLIGAQGRSRRSRARRRLTRGAESDIFFWRFVNKPGARQQDVKGVAYWLRHRDDKSLIEEANADDDTNEERIIERGRAMNKEQANKLRVEHSTCESRRCKKGGERRGRAGGKRHLYSQ